MQKFTILSSIDLAHRKQDLYFKLKELVRKAEKNQICIVISHNDRNGYFDRKIKKIQNNKYVKIISGFFYKELSNQSLLRNISFQKIKTEYVLLLDIDIFFDSNLFFYLLNKVEENSNIPFAMAPCLYLTKYGSKKIMNKNKLNIFELYLNYDFKVASHLAIPSSVIMFRKKDFITIEGFDEQYIGHGYEDFDFIIRLAKLYGKQFSINEKTDVTYQAPFFVSGFRETLALYCLESLLDNQISYHLFHKKTKNSYLEKRSDNKNYFLEKFNEEVDFYKKYNFLRELVSMCLSRNIKIERYSSLFDTRPYYIKDTSFSRKLKRFFKFFYV